MTKNDNSNKFSIHKFLLLSKLVSAVLCLVIFKLVHTI